MADTDPIELARGLLRCPSVTPAEGGALALIEGVLKAAGFAVHRVTFAEPGTAPVENLYARIGEAAPHLTFAGHTDVVPPGDAAAWRHGPFAGEIVDGTLYGRGAVDMKGAVACAIAASLDHVAAHGAPKGSISFLITGDEESVAVNGTVKLLQWAAGRGEKFDHCILGEPSNASALGDTIKVGRRGSLNGTLVISGKQGHVAYPERADNPVRGLVTLMSALMAEPLDHGSDHFTPSNLEFTSIDIGNPVVNLIPGEARARFNIRFNDHHSQVALRTLIEHRAAAAAGGRVRWKIEWEPSNADPFLTRIRHLRRPRGRRDRRRDRPHADALDHRRHFRRTLHQELLPGARIRPGRADHASGRRAHAGRRPHDADGGIPGDSRSLFRLIFFLPQTRNARGRQATRFHQDCNAISQTSIIPKFSHFFVHCTYGTAASSPATKRSTRFRLTKERLL